MSATSEPAPGRAATRRPTRLLLVTSLYPTSDNPAAGAFVGARVDALRARGVRVEVVAADDYRQSAARRHARMLARALTTRGRFDGVEGHVLFPAGGIAYLAARLRRVPVLVYAHGADVYQTPYRSPIHRFLATWIARHADAVVTNSEETAGDVARLGREATVIPPGFDPERFRPIAGTGDGDGPGAGETRPDIRARLGLPAGHLALYLGALIERKGADVFADAMDRADGWCGLAVGAGELDGRLASEHPALLRRPPVPASEVPSLLRAADVVVVPSRREPLGMAAVEALACGTPVIASSVGGLREVVRDGENGLLVPPGDPDAVADALRRLRTDEALLARLTAAARGSVAGHAMPLVAERMAAAWASLGVEA